MNVSTSGIGTDCAAGPAAAALDAQLQALNSTMTALSLSSLTATYYCIPTVGTSVSFLCPSQRDRDREQAVQKTSILERTACMSSVLTLLVERFCLRRWVGKG